MIDRYGGLINWIKVLLDRDKSRANQEERWLLYEIDTAIINNWFTQKKIKEMMVVMKDVLDESR